jgi:hypothetical protein
MFKFNPDLVNTSLSLSLKLNLEYMSDRPGPGGGPGPVTKLVLLYYNVKHEVRSA